MSLPRKLAEWIVNSRFRIKLMLSYFFLVSFIILILGFAYYQISARNMLDNVKESVSNVVMNNNLLLEGKLQAIRDNTDVLPIDNELYEVLAGVDPKNTESLLKTDRRITQILYKYFGRSPEVYSSFVMTRFYSFGNNAQMYVPADAFYGTDLVRQARSGQGNLIWIPTYSFADIYKQNDMRTLSFDYNELFSAVKELYQTYIDNDGAFLTLPAGVEKPILLLNFKPEFIRQVFEDYARKNEYANVSFGVISREGSVVTDSNEEGIPRAGNSAPSWLSEARSMREGSFIKTVDGRKTLICFDLMESTDWLSYIQIPVDDALHDLNALKLYSIVFLVLMLLVSALFAYLLSIFITRPIIRIKKGIKLMERGNFQVFIPGEGRDEFGHLIQKFNQMNERIHELIEQNYASRIREKDAELMALNLQLNPHFLYNTLTTIYWIAVENKQDEISRIMLSLAEMLKSTTRNKNETWPLRTDLDWLNRYIYIMGSRFEDKFTVTIKMEEDMLEAEVPKLFLQPFVENAIIHGFEEIESGGSIHISGWLEGNSLLFSVEDNGKGFDQPSLEGFRNGQSRLTGMQNVDKRIRLLYGPEFGVEVISPPGGGATILVRISGHNRKSNEKLQIQ
ncbi:sensor histidine kinase [Paenibacillus sepulcri]|uniref:Sensor histidine kinase n=1 Tax=Paenibacillus sepulcri TaxID=359917 RepID=A0ABS7C533_9BACL|nr:sensor histidine kinase [Paenibacillus sepulcri]